jgi:hypothetical protein
MEMNDCMDLCIVNRKRNVQKKSDHQRHTLRDRRPSTAFCPACWTMGTKTGGPARLPAPWLPGDGDTLIEIVYVKEIIFYSGLTRAAKKAG